MSVDDLTTEEIRAIASLRRLARRWPETLTLFSWSGSLVVLHTADKDRLTEVGASQAEKSDLENLRTFREDYEIYGAKDGVIKVDYSGHCDVCSLGLDFTDERPLPVEA